MKPSHGVERIFFRGKGQDLIPCPDLDSALFSLRVLAQISIVPLLQDLGSSEALAGEMSLGIVDL